MRVQGFSVLKKASSLLLLSFARLHGPKACTNIYKYIRIYIISNVKEHSTDQFVIADDQNPDV